MAMNLDSMTSQLRPDYDFPLQSPSVDSGARGKIFRAISPGSHVLDIGCDTGRFGEALIVEKQCQVDGIEAWESAVELAKTRLHQVFNRTIQTERSFDGLEDYDYVLFLCVLEHLQDPWAALKGALKALKEGGHVYVIVPNISHISIVRRLVLGQFDYTEYGTMDYTHLRWFTRKSLKNSLEKAGFSNVEIQGIPLVPYVGENSLVSKFTSTSLSRLFPDLFSGSLVGYGVKPKLF